MNNEYTASEVIEIGKAQEVILGIKVPGDPDQDGKFLSADDDLDG